MRIEFRVSRFELQGRNWFWWEVLGELGRPRKEERISLIGSGRGREGLFGRRAL